MANIIPITSSIITQHHNDLLLYLTYLTSCCGVQVDWDYKPPTVYIKQELKDSECRKRLQDRSGWCRQTISKYFNAYHNEVAAEFTSPMPVSLFDQIAAADGMTFEQRNHLLRTFCYLHLNCLQFGKFQQSQENMATALGYKRTDLRRDLNWIIEHNLIKVSSKHFYDGESGFATVFMLYEDELPYFLLKDKKENIDYSKRIRSVKS